MRRLTALRNLPLRVICITFLVMLLTLRIADPAPVSAVREAVFDLYQRILPRPYQESPVVIVDIDDASLRTIGQWPWPRTDIARLLDRAAEAGAAVVGLDIVFSEPDRLSADQLARLVPEEMRGALDGAPSTDKVLAEAMADIPTVAGETSLRLQVDARRSDTASDTPHAFIGGDARLYLRRFPDLVRNRDVIDGAAAGRGVFTVLPDPDGIVRRIPLALLTGKTLRLALAAEVLRVGTGGDAVGIRVNAAGIEEIILARRAFPTARDATVRPWFAPARSERLIPAAELLAGRVAPERLAGKIVLVGTSAIGLEDYRATPLGVPMPGVEIHAQLLDAMLTDTLLRRPSAAIAQELVATAVLGAIFIAVVPALSAMWTIALASAATFGIAAYSWVAFSTSQVLFDASYPIAALVLLIATLITANYMREEQQRRAIRSAFGQYVSPDVVSRLADAPETLRLGGERRDLTVLFADLRDFTALAEGYGDRPEDLTTLMNRLLTVLSRAVLDRGGTIDKFIGDGLMAFWNAPLDREDHAFAACHAALAMQSDLAALDPESSLAVGIGINTGAAIVGNMGSDLRFDYTALGDTVNLASRLEGTSKTYGVPIVLGEETERAVRDSFAVLELDMAQVKGRSDPVRIFALLGSAELAVHPDWLALKGANQAALAALARGDWSSAEGHAADIRTRASLLALPLHEHAAGIVARAQAGQAVGA